MAHVTSAVRYVLSHGLLVKRKQWTSYRSRNHHCSDLMGETRKRTSISQLTYNLLSKRSVQDTLMCFWIFFFFPLQLVAGLCKNTCRMRMLTGEEKQKKKKKILTLSICYRVYNCINTDAQVATFLTYC